jgi:L-malate glycosyltransferase
MNILYITNHLNIGGITTYVLSLSVAMKKRGHNVYVASSGGRLLQRFIDEGINYVPIPINTKQEASPKIIFSMLELAKALDKSNINLLHSNSRTTQVLGCLLNKFKGIPHISTCHGFFKKRFFRKVFPCWPELVIAISESVKAHLIKDFGVDAKRIVVIHNGIDVERFRSQKPESVSQKKKILGLSDGPVVSIVARLSQEKGHAYLIEAMREVINYIPEAQLLIVGDGRMKAVLTNLTKALELENNIVFLSSVMDAQEALSLTDIFVLSSLKEGLGLSLMEAMASGLAVIGSDIGGIKSLIQDKVNGLLVEPKDALQLSKSILELISNEEKRKFLGRNAQSFILREFSLEKTARKTEEVYLQCLGAKH